MNLAKKDVIMKTGDDPENVTLWGNGIPKTRTRTPQRKFTIGGGEVAFATETPNLLGECGSMSTHFKCLKLRA